MITSCTSTRAYIQTKVLPRRNEIHWKTIEDTYTLAHNYASLHTKNTNTTRPKYPHPHPEIQENNAGNFGNLESGICKYSTCILFRRLLHHSLLHRQEKSTGND